MIASINKTNQILKKYNIKAKKNFGQNFIIDSNIIKKLVDISLVDKETVVIEIGPGLGSMTELLLEKCFKVIAFEIDNVMKQVLENELDNTNLEIIFEDFLKVDINKLIKTIDKKVVVVSNLPYYITSPILFKLLDSDIEEIYVMVQKEFGERLTAKPGTKEYGSLTVITSFLADVKIEASISRNSFSPVPNVDSVFLSIKKKKIDCSLFLDAYFKQFIRNIFSMRRKTLINNIISKYEINKYEFECKLLFLKYPLLIRSEMLDIEDIMLIYNAFLETRIS